MESNLDRLLLTKHSAFEKEKLANKAPLGKNTLEDAARRAPDPRASAGTVVVGRFACARPTGSQAVFVA